MSLFKTMTIDCPDCGQKSEFQAVGSVNADRRPDLRAQILDNSFQVVTCPGCEKTIRLEPEFNMLDVGHGQWIAAYPGRRIGDYIAVEDLVQSLFDESYGAAATASAREVGALLDLRLTFGWPGTREKVFLRENGLDDVVIEMLKLDLLRRLPEAPLAPGIELRAVGVDDEMLTFVWIETDSERVLQEFSASRALVREIEENPDGWAAIRASLTDGAFVDMQKLYLGEGRSAA